LQLGNVIPSCEEYGISSSLNHAMMCAYLQYDIKVSAAEYDSVDAVIILGSISSIAWRVQYAISAGAKHNMVRV
jgi:hypothetical protein